MSLVGESRTQAGAWDRAASAITFPADLRLPGMLFGAALRCPLPKARVESVELDGFRAPAGAAFLSASSLGGPGRLPVPGRRLPALAGEVAEFAGQAVALVGAETPADLYRALQAVDSEYSPLEPCLDPAASEAEIVERVELVRGAIDPAFRRAALVLETTFEIGPRDALYLEPLAAVAWRQAGRWEIVVSAQDLFAVRMAVAGVLGEEPEAVRVRCPAVGGAFGGKLADPLVLASQAALLARHAGRPVSLALDRRENNAAASKGGGVSVWRRLAADRSGRLEAVDLDILVDGGADPVAPRDLLTRAVLHAVGPYRCPHLRIRARVARTNTLPKGPVRGGGAASVQFAAERQMDLLAARLGLSPLEIRRRNVLMPGDRLPTGQVLDASASGAACLERLADLTDFEGRWGRSREEARSRRGGIRRGFGLSLSFHGVGRFDAAERAAKARVSARLLPDGRIELGSGAVELGQNLAAAQVRLVVQALGLASGDVVASPPDTLGRWDAGPTTASRGLAVVGGAMVSAVGRLRDRVLRRHAVRSGTARALPSVIGGEVHLADGGRTTFRELARELAEEAGSVEIVERIKPPLEEVFDPEALEGAAYSTYAWSAQLVEVEVDPGTLVASPLRASVVCDIGRVIDRTHALGQVEGGVVQSLGWALAPEVVEVDAEGDLARPDALVSCPMLSPEDAPLTDVHFLEIPARNAALGAKGLGALSGCGAAPAAASAVAQATGLSVRSIPTTPEVLADLESAQAEALESTAGSTASGRFLERS